MAKGCAFYLLPAQIYPPFKNFTGVYDKEKSALTLALYALPARGSVAQWIAHWTSSKQWEKPFKGCGFESHQNRKLFRTPVAVSVPAVSAFCPLMVSPR